MRKDSTGYSAPRGDNNDCSVRALSIAANIPYEEAHALFAAAGRVSGRRTPWSVSDSVHGTRGDAPIIPRLGGAARRWPTLAHFLSEHPRGRFVVHRRGHAFAVVDGVVHDWANGTGPRSRVRSAFRVKKA